MAKDYYSILGAKRNASEKEIRRAYRRLARKHHPDVNPGDKAAEERFKEITGAYEVLSDSAKRRKYDRYGENWKQAERIEEAARQAGGRFSAGGGPDLGDLFQGSGFEGIFGTVFGRGRRRAGPMRGQNLEYGVEVSLEEAYLGTSRRLALQGEEACATCGGGGRIADVLCHTCQGAGAVLQPRNLEVRIPAGVRSGSRVRIAGEGRPGSGGGPKGDLYLVVSVRPNKRFERKGDNLHTEVDVPLDDVVLGGEVSVATLAGKQVMLKVPPLTQNGKMFRLAGLGMPHLESKGKGDLLARVRVALPEELSEQEQALFKELKALRKRPKAEAKA